MILEYKNQIIDYIEAVDMNPLLKVKAVSMFHRFESQEIAIHEIFFWRWTRNNENFE